MIAPGDVDGGDLAVVKEQFLEALFAPFKLNFSPFQPGPGTRDKARAGAWLPPLGVLKGTR